MYSFLGRSVLVASLVIFTGISAIAQQKGGTLGCREDNWNNDKSVGHCEMREQTLAPSGGTIAIDGRQRIKCLAAVRYGSAWASVRFPCTTRFVFSAFRSPSSPRSHRSHCRSMSCT